MKPLLIANQLRKHFKNTKAVDGIDITLNSGECFALLAPMAQKPPLWKC